MLTKHQDEVLTQALEYLKTEDFILIKGSAGVGKTFLVDVLIKQYPIPGGKRFCCTAPTNKAVKVIKDKVLGHKNVDFMTTHSALKLNRSINGKTGEVKFTPQKYNERYPPLKDVKVLIIDEASMLSTQLLNLVEETAKAKGCKVIFIGDDKQINPVNEEESPVFLRDYPTVELTEIVRQGEGNPIIKLSRNLHLTKRKQNVFGNMEMTKGYVFSENKAKVIYELSRVNGTDEFKYLAWTNKDVNSINKEVRENIYGNPNKIELGETLVFNSPYKQDYFTNEEIKVETLDIVEETFSYTNNINGESNTKDENLMSVREIKLKCYFINAVKDKDGTIVSGVPVIHEDSEKDYLEVFTYIKNRIVLGYTSWKHVFAFKEQFGDVTYNHAITVHKSQGSTYKNVIINLKNINFNKNTKERTRLLYTAITRASDLVIFYNQ